MDAFDENLLNLSDEEGEKVDLEDWPEEIEEGIKRPRQTSDQEEEEKKKKMKDKEEPGEEEEPSEELKNKFQALMEKEAAGFIFEEALDIEGEEISSGIDVGQGDGEYGDYDLKNLEFENVKEPAEEVIKVVEEVSKREEIKPKKNKQTHIPCEKSPDEPCTINFPIPVYYMATIDNGYALKYINETLYPIKRGDSSKVRDLAEMRRNRAERMLRRWIYLIPYERPQDIIKSGGRRYHKDGRTGLLLWDPLLEYFEAMGEGGDNVKGLLRKLQQNAADPEKREDIIFVGNNTLPNELHKTKKDRKETPIYPGAKLVEDLVETPQKRDIHRNNALIFVTPKWILVDMDKNNYFKLEKDVNKCLWNLYNDENIDEVLESMTGNPNIINLFSASEEVHDKLLKEGNWVFTKKSNNLYERLGRQIRLSERDEGYKARAIKEAKLSKPIQGREKQGRKLADYKQLDCFKNLEKPRKIEEDLGEIAAIQEAKIASFNQKYEERFFSGEKNQNDRALEQNLEIFKENPENVNFYEIPMNSPHAHYPTASEALDTAELLQLINQGVGPSVIEQLVKFYFGVGVIESLKKLNIDTNGYNAVLPDFVIAASPVPLAKERKEPKKETRKKEEPKKRPALPPSPKVIERERSKKRASSPVYKYVRDDNSFKRENGKSSVRYFIQNASSGEEYPFWVHCTQCNAKFELKSSKTLDKIVSKLTDNFIETPNYSRIDNGRYDKDGEYFEIDGCAHCVLSFE